MFILSQKHIKNYIELLRILMINADFVINILSILQNYAELRRVVKIVMVYYKINGNYLERKGRQRITIQQKKEYSK